MSQNAESNWEANEIGNWLSNHLGWPIKPGRYDALEDVAAQLKQELLLDKDASKTYPDIYQSFVNHGGNWQAVDWKELAESCMSDYYGDDWGPEDEDEDSDEDEDE